MKYYPPRYLFRRQELLRLVQPGRAFLEVGPGNLYLAQALLTRFEQGTLVEFSDTAKARLAALPPLTQRRLSLHITDFFEFEPETLFDCFVACEVLEHVAEDGRFLQKAHSVLKPNGQILLSMPAHMAAWSDHDTLVGHVRRYEKRPLRQLLAQSGFTDIQILSYGYPFINMLRWPRLLLARRQQSQVAQLDETARTQWSGDAQTEAMPSLAGWLINPVTIYPLGLIARLFNGFDWSDGYVVSARKRGD